MSPETRSRTINTLLGAAIPVLAFAQIAFYSWADAGSSALDIVILHDAWWWIGGLALFIALLLAAGFVATGEEPFVAPAASPADRASGRGIGPVARVRIAWALLVAAFVAHFFYVAAFASWSASVSFIIRYRFLSFQDWRWWVGGFVTFFGCLIAAAVVMAGDAKSRTLRVTPIDDPGHELRLDEHGNEMAPVLEADRDAALPDAPEPQDVSSDEASEQAAPAYAGDTTYPSSMRWLRFGIAWLITLLMVHYWVIREIRIDYVVVVALAYALVFLSWRVVRAR